MPGLSINIDGKGGAYAAELRGRDVEFTESELLIETLDGGMETGKPSVGIIYLLPGGRAVVAQTSLKLFQLACAATIGKYGNVTGNAVLGTLKDGAVNLTFSESTSCPVCRKSIPNSCKFCYECGGKL